MKLTADELKMLIKFNNDQADYYLECKNKNTKQLEDMTENPQLENWKICATRFDTLHKCFRNRAREFKNSEMQNTIENLTYFTANTKDN